MRSMYVSRGICSSGRMGRAASPPVPALPPFRFSSRGTSPRNRSSRAPTNSIVEAHRAIHSAHRPRCCTQSDADRSAAPRLCDSTAGHLGGLSGAAPTARNKEQAGTGRDDRIGDDRARLTTSDHRPQPLHRLQSLRTCLSRGRDTWHRQRQGCTRVTCRMHRSWCVSGSLPTRSHYARIWH